MAHKISSIFGVEEPFTQNMQEKNKTCKRVYNDENDTSSSSP